MTNGQGPYAVYMDCAANEELAASASILP